MKTFPRFDHGHRNLDDAQGLAAWWTDPSRWRGVVRSYAAEDVLALRGTLPIEFTLARHGAERLWNLLQSEPYVHALGAMTGNQALQMISAGLDAIYVSGWQAAADSNPAGQMYPDLNLYSCDSVPTVVRRINNALLRADQMNHAEGKTDRVWLAPLVADGDSGFGGNLNTYELMRSMIEAGAAGVHFEDQLASAKRCGHLGGKVLVPTAEMIGKLTAARLAADVAGVPTVIVARTDAEAATMMSGDGDPRDRAFLTGERSSEGLHVVRNGIEQAIARGLAYAPYCDLLWCETAKPDVLEARRFADAIHARFPGKMLAYNCSPSFNWRAQLDDAAIARFQRELGLMGYKFQFVTLAGFHTLNHSMFELASAYRDGGMTAYTALQEKEFSRERDGYLAAKHQRFVGAAYFDRIALVASGGATSTTALKNSTEEEQFTGRNGRKSAPRADMPTLS